MTSSPAAPGVLLQGTLSIALLSLVVCAATAGDVLVGGVGGWSWLILLAFAGAIWVISKSQDLQSWMPTGLADAASVGDPGQGGSIHEMPLNRLVVLTVLAGGTILVAGFFLAKSGEALAAQTGLGTSFFGAALMGLSTSLPEVSTVLAAVRLRRYEMAIAGVFGTNIFNVTIIVLVDALHPGGPVLVEAGRFAAFAALLAIVLTTVFLVGMIERRDRTVLRMGFDSLIAIVCYAGGLLVLFQLR